MPKVLVVYYSFSNGNTKIIAEQLQKYLASDIARLDTVKAYSPYTGADCEMVNQALKEVEEGFCPQIKPLPYDVRDHDVIAIGTPTWWYSITPAVRTFLKANNWEGKIVIPFMTHGGWPGHVLKDIRENCNGSEFLSGFEVQYDSHGGSQLITKPSEIDSWLETVRQEISRIN